MVYGIFRDYENKLVIWRGEITSQEDSRVTVKFENDKYWTYSENDIGKIAFYNENEARTAVEELRRRRRWE